MKTKPISSTAIAFGGEEIQVIRRDGVTETVKVRLLKIVELAVFLQLITDEVALAAFVVGKPVDWAASLSTRSQLDIIEVAHALNFSAARSWLAWRVALNEAATPFMANQPPQTTPTT